VGNGTLASGNLHAGAARGVVRISARRSLNAPVSNYAKCRETAWAVGVPIFAIKYYAIRNDAPCGSSLINKGFRGYWNDGDRVSTKQRCSFTTAFDARKQRRKSPRNDCCRYCNRWLLFM